MKGCFQNSKANMILEGLTVLIVVVIFALAALYGHSAFKDVNDDIQADDDMSEIAKGTSGNLFNVYADLMDNLFLFALFLFTVFVIIAVFLIDTHPIFLGVSVMLLIGVIVAAVFVANAYNDIASDDTISASANEMPFISWYMRHLVETILGITFMVGVALFAKFRM